jgi:hypothetical protein
MAKLVSMGKAWLSKSVALQTGCAFYHAVTPQHFI